eukprot:SAG31_NODE_5479_length_2515_cov_5.563328_1_plen_52_part_00
MRWMAATRCSAGQLQTSAHSRHMPLLVVKHALTMVLTLLNKNLEFVISYEY